MSDRGELSGKVALVTGAGSGIGKAIAVALAGAGARVAATDIDPELAEATAAAIPGAIAGRLDVTSAASARDAVARAEAALGPIDILCNNAGVSTMNRLQDLSEREWDFNFGVNAKGVFLVTQAVLPGMIARQGGCIVNTASMAGKRPPPCSPTTPPRSGPASASPSRPRSSSGRTASASTASAPATSPPRCRSASSAGRANCAA